MTDCAVDFSVIIPAYNEAGSIGPVLERLAEHLDGLGRAYEILVVVDGASDATAAEVRAVNAAIRLIEHPYNMGNGAAVKTGIRNAWGEVLVFMDADGQHAPEDVERLLADCQRYDMVVGARGRGSQAGWHRGLANAIYNYLASYVTGRRIEDLTSGFRAMRREVARRFVGLLPNGYSYPTTITLCFMRAGFSVKYAPIEAAKRKGGKSQIRLVSDGTKFLLVIAKICMLFSPLKIFLPVSLYLLLMGIGYYGYTFITTHRFTNMSMLLFTTSVMVLMMGLIAEQIAQMRFERTEDV
ncbi:MAG: glycosyltransferase family 2 protein [Candidatus Latescibacterota bacterium]|nr:glycosyltransferase family 2 protein [Candidatus Latescibacterota bacterium]